MSSDNYLYIWKHKDGKYRGCDLCASEEHEWEPKANPVFEENTLEEAIKRGQDYCDNEIVEYGMHFGNL